MMHQGIEDFLIDMTGDGQFAVIIHIHAAVLGNPVINNRIARPADESFHLAAASQPNNLRSSADIDNNQRPFHFGGQRFIINRRKRRPLPAGQNIGVAEPRHGADTGKIRHQLSVADLMRIMFGRPVTNGMAAKTENIRHQRLFLHKAANRCRRKFTEGNFGTTDINRVFRRVRPFSQHRTNLIQQFVFIRHRPGRPPAINVNAVGFRHRQPESVKGCGTDNSHRRQIFNIIHDSFKNIITILHSENYMLICVKNLL